jgi:hypothetical protein
MGADISQSNPRLAPRRDRTNARSDRNQSEGGAGKAGEHDASLARSGQARRGTRSSRSGLWLVHRRIRHARSEGGQRFTRRADVRAPMLLHFSIRGCRSISGFSTKIKATASSRPTAAAPIFSCMSADASMASKSLPKARASRSRNARTPRPNRPSIALPGLDLPQANGDDRSRHGKGLNPQTADIPTPSRSSRVEAIDNSRLSRHPR